MTTEKVIQTIKKVLELSKNNPSEEEAKAAALKAQELLAKYHISMKEVDDISSEEMERIDEVRVNVPAKSWKYTLARIVADNFCCRHFYYGKSVVVFYGHRSDAEIAAETFKYLFEFGNKNASRYVAKKKLGGRTGLYNSYVVGFCKGVEEALAKQCTALMLVVPEDVKSAYEDMSKDFKHSRAKSASAGLSDGCVKAFSEGKITGKEAMNSRKIEG